MGLALALASLLVAIGCGDDASDVDASPDTGADDAAMPMGPTLTPCPPGWREVNESGLTHCDPWPEGGQAECPAGEAHFPGEEGCRPVGSRCPEGEFPEIVEEEGRTYLYVRAGGSVGGSGTRDDPFGTLSSVSVDASAEATTYVLSKGEHTVPFGVLFPGGGVTMQGACTRETLLVGDVLTNDLLTVSSGRTELRDLTIGPSRTFTSHGVSVMSGAELVLDGVEFGSGIAYGVRVAGGSLDASNIHAEDLLILVLAETGGPIRVRRTVLTTTSAITARGHVDADFEDVAMSDTRFSAFGVAVGNLTLRRLSVQRGRYTGIFLGNRVPSGSPPQISAEDIVITETLPGESAAFPDEISDGRAIVVQNAELTLRRAHVNGSRELGIYAAQNAVVNAEDIAVRRSISGCATCVARGGTGVGVYLRASVSIRRFLIDEADLCGVHIGPEGALDLAYGTVARSRIGACIPDGYDIPRVSATVRYVDNELNLGAETLPVPEPLTQVE